MSVDKFEVIINSQPRIDIENISGIKRLFWKIFGGVVDFIDPDDGKTIMVTLSKRDVRKALGSRFKWNDLQNIINAAGSKPVEEAKPAPAPEPTPAPVVQPIKKYKVKLTSALRLAALQRKNVARPQSLTRDLISQIEKNRDDYIALANSQEKTAEADNARLALADYYLRYERSTVEDLNAAQRWLRKLSNPSDQYAQALLGVLMQSTD